MRRPSWAGCSSPGFWLASSLQRCPQRCARPHRWRAPKPFARPAPALWCMRQRWAKCWQAGDLVAEIIDPIANTRPSASRRAWPAFFMPASATATSPPAANSARLPAPRRFEAAICWVHEPHFTDQHDHHHAQTPGRKHPQALWRQRGAQGRVADRPCGRRDQHHRQLGFGQKHVFALHQPAGKTATRAASSWPAKSCI